MEVAMKSTVASLLAWVSMFSVFAPSVYATPPTPPAQIILEQGEALSRLEASREGFDVPVRVQTSGPVSNLVVRVRVLSTDPIKPVELSSKRVQISERNREGLSLQFPVQSQDGTYRIEIELFGTAGDSKGLIDRKVIYQRVQQGKAQLLSPEQLRRADQQRRRESFKQKLATDPDRPDVRLLRSDTVKVPAEIAAKIKPADERTRLMVRPTGPVAEIRPYVVDRKDQAWGAVDPITVRGRLVYQDFEGTWRPLVNVSVNLYDDDTFGDEHLGTTVTDWNGEWSFTVNNDDGWLQNGRDIYYEFHLGNTRWDVHDDDGDAYVWQSATHDDLSDGAVVDFGTETGSTDPTAMQVFGVINLGWNHIVTEGGQDPGYVEVQHPTSATNHQSGLVNIASGDSDGPDSILHEYGHALMYRAFGNTNISPGGAHGFDDDMQDPGLAYSEGWATGFMLSFCPDGQYNWHEGSSEGAGEWPTCTSQSDFGRNIENFSDSANRVGERNEGRVAAAINDFRDAPNDDNGGSEDRGRHEESDANSGNRISLSTIYRDSMWGFVHNDFLDFWFTFSGNLSGTTRSRADDIMQYNWMSLPVDLSCVASKVTASLSKEPESLLSGLRAFRDQALKPTANGRRWIQTYYSNSPELAMLLIRDGEARKAALGVIQHFSRLGNALVKHQQLERLVAGNERVIPEAVGKQIEIVLQTIERNGSEALKAELPALREEIRSLSAMSMRDAVQRAERSGTGISDKPQTTIRPRALNPASQKADWTLIRQHLPRSESTSVEQR
jgi:hypothetical protein